MPIQHGTIAGDAVHVPYAGTFANAAARTGATGLDSTQHGKLFRQLDDNSLWMLVSTSPLTWKSLSPDRVASAGYADNAGNADTCDGFHFAWNDPGTHPNYLLGGNDGNIKVFPPSRLSVNYANSSGYAGNTGNIGGVIGYGLGVYEYPDKPKFYAPQGGQWIILYNNGMSIPHPNGMGNIASFALTAGAIYTGGSLIHEGDYSSTRGSSSADTGVFFRIG